MLMQNYVLLVLVGCENIFHRAEGHRASRLLCDEGRKYEPLKPFKWFPHCLGLRARLGLFQHTQPEQGPELYMDRGVICERLLGPTYGHNLKEGTTISFSVSPPQTHSHLLPPDHSARISALHLDCRSRLHLSNAKYRMLFSNCRLASEWLPFFCC